MPKSIDDSQLLRLAADPRTTLFPPLGGGNVFGPFVFLAGLYACLALVMAGEFRDVDSLWGLRALDLPAATEVQDWLEPGRNGWGSGAALQPPLATWVAALAIPNVVNQSPVSWRLLSVAMTCFTIWAMYLLGRRLGGAAFGACVVVAMCGHPVILNLATSTGPGAMGLLWLALTVWGFLGHLEGPPQLVSMRMLAGSVAWGLALLTVGPVAVALFFPMVLHSWLLHEGRHQSNQTRWSRLWHLWLGIRTLAGFLITALSFSGWWQLMMLTNYGTEFSYAWCTGQIRLYFPSTDAESFWREWLQQNTFLIGFLTAGLVTVANELRSPTTELDRRRCQFILLWWLTALIFRGLFNTPLLCQSGLIEAWDGMLLLPTVLLAAWGARAIVLRQISATGEASLLVFTVGLAVWRATRSPWLGVLCAVLALVAISVLPTVAPRFRRGFRQWSERDWRFVLQFSMVIIAIGHLTAGLLEFPAPTSECRTLAEFRKRIAALPSDSRLALVSPNGRVPEALLFVVRSHFPDSTQVSGAREGALTRELKATPQVGELVVEWTQYEVGIMNELPADRQAASIGDPLRFRGRRLMIYKVEQRQL